MGRVYAGPIHRIVFEGREKLGLTQREFGEALGASQRSAARWDARHASPSTAQLAKLATLLFPRDRELAAECATAAGETLVSLGLVPEPAADAPAKAKAGPAAATTAAPATPDLARVRREDLVDLIVLAAVEQSAAPPSEVRTWLHAAFVRARGLGLTVEEVEQTLAAALKRRARNRRRPRSSPKAGGR